MSEFEVGEGMSDRSRDINELVARADALRDARSYRAAAEGYRSALALAPTRADLWVQLGNMSKDSNDFAGAVTAYREALRWEPNSSDTYLQLGRAQKLWGRTDDAFEAFAQALSLAPGLYDAVREVVDLGLSWRLERSTGLGTTLALSVTTALDDLKAAIVRIERELPTIRSLSAVPVEHYDEFRRLYDVPPAELAGLAPRAGVIVLGEAPLDAMRESLISIKNQRCPAEGAKVPALRYDGLAAIRAVLPNAVTGGASSTSGEVAACAAELPDAAWLLLMKEPALLHPEALGWIIGEGERTSAVAVFCDEDSVIRDGSGRLRHVEPQLRAELDPELVLQCFDPGVVLAVRSDILNGCIASLGNSSEISVFWGKLVLAVSARGYVAHVPQVLVSRFNNLPPSGSAARASATAASPVPPVRREVDVDVIIPTRNGLALTEACSKALLATAVQKSRLKITIVDNGSDDPATLAWLANGRASGQFAVIENSAPFNWSQLNNIAVAATSSPLVLFLNNDVELVSEGWDEVLRELLARDEVGVVGARLAYPDKTLQHAGIVLGVNGVSEHEGRGEPMTAPGPLGRWQMRRSVSAVTGAFLACRRDVFKSLGGFDADSLPVWFSDVDFCLKASSAALRVLYEPQLLGIHHESKSIAAEFADAERNRTFETAASIMRDRWGTRVEHDPWYSPHYSKFAKPYTKLAARPAPRVP